MKMLVLGPCLLFICGLPKVNALAEDGFPFIGCFELASKSHNIDLDLLLAVAAVESNWDADARSSAGAHGVMQIRWPVTARYLGARRTAELYNPCLNIDLGAGYLAELFNRYDGDLEMVLAAYNYGPTRLKTHRDIPQTVAGYVRKVTRKREEIGRRMNQSTSISTSEKKLAVIRFDRTSRAENYVKAIVSRVPGAILEIVPAADGGAVVYLDTAGLNVSTRFTLAKLIPELGSALIGNE